MPKDVKESSLAGDMSEASLRILAAVLRSTLADLVVNQPDLADMAWELLSRVEKKVNA